MLPRLYRSPSESEDGLADISAEKALVIWDKRTTGDERRHVRSYYWKAVKRAKTKCTHMIHTHAFVKIQKKYRRKELCTMFFIPKTHQVTQVVFIFVLF